MILLIKKGLNQIINDIDSGNTNLSEKELLLLVNTLSQISRKELSKTESADYIGVSKSTFENYINKGLIPKGTKEPGKLLFWLKSDLDKYLNKNG